MATWSDLRDALYADLETALLHEIRSAWHGINDRHFRRVLKSPSFLLVDVDSRLGRYELATRTLELSRKLAMKEPWTTLIEVLKHEMAHQYVLEVLRVEDESSHGPAFRDVCARLGIDARAAGLPDISAHDKNADEDKVLAKVARLLALAESSSIHEAESAMKAAQRLMLKHNLERATFRNAGAQSYSYRFLGKPTGRVTEAERVIGAILTEHFFVEAIWISVYRPLEQKRGTVLEVCGTPSNLELASYVHSFLMHAGDRLWVEHQRESGIASNRDRRTFISGVMSGFLARLNADRSAQQKEGLVWLGDAELRGYYKKRHPSVVNVRYGGTPRNDAHAKGKEAGQRLVLHRPVTQGSNGGGPKLLGK